MRIWSLIFLIFVIVITGAITGVYIKNRGSYASPFDTNAVKIKLMNKQELPQGLSFFLSLKNESNLTIVQNNVFVSFPIKVQNGTTANPSKVMATGNKLNINPHEEVQLHVFFPKESIGDTKLLDIDHPAVDAIGYVSKIKDENRFGLYISLD